MSEREIKRGAVYYLSGSYPAVPVTVITPPTSSTAEALVKHPTGPTYQDPSRMHGTERQANEATLSEKLTQLANFTASVTRLQLDIDVIEAALKEQA